ncbi:hypothetical protein EXIGLDRAFT_701610 [Exidia glandulosa HHB12029]|uniref:C2H2-type domain-containing protein n=1 Tax=Exidia glandulosa HHB12029 TaxID=1314781 RepID=A0A165Q308_EXIGL|nr:hypothetical protein EXIGLDRAFT_701610 [Exidia glandulosa HHB12029]
MASHADTQTEANVLDERDLDWNLLTAALGYDPRLSPDAGDNTNTGLDEIDDAHSVSDDPSMYSFPALVSSSSTSASTPTLPSTSFPATPSMPVMDPIFGDFTAASKSDDTTIERFEDDGMFNGFDFESDALHAADGEPAQQSARYVFGSGQPHGFLDAQASEVDADGAAAGSHHSVEDVGNDEEDDEVDDESNVYAGRPVVRKEIPTKQAAYSGAHEISPSEAKELVARMTPRARGESWPCPLCDPSKATAYSTSAGLIRHLKAGYTAFECGVCHRRYERQAQCTNHERLHYFASNEDADAEDRATAAGLNVPSSLAGPLPSSNALPAAVKGHRFDEATAKDDTRDMPNRGSLQCPRCSAPPFLTKTALRNHLMNGPRQCPTCNKTLQRYHDYLNHVGKCKKDRRRGTKRACEDDEEDNAPGPSKRARRSAV